MHFVQRHFTIPLLLILAASCARSTDPSSRGQGAAKATDPHPAALTTVLAANAHPYWDLWPRYSNGDQMPGETGLQTMQDIDANMGGGIGGYDDEGRGPMFRQSSYLSSQASIQALQAGGVHAMGYMEGQGQSSTFVGALHQLPDGSFEQDAQLGAANIISNWWAWAYNGPGLNPDANYPIWFGIPAFVNSAPWQGPYVLSNAAYSAIPTPTYPDGTSALGYLNVYPPGAPAGAADPRNAKVFDALASKDINGAYRVDPTFQLPTGATGNVNTADLASVINSSGAASPTGYLAFSKDEASPFWLAYNTNVVQWDIANGGEGYWMDNASGWDFMGSQPTTTAFGEWSVAQFRSYLTEQGISAPGGNSGFDVRSYLMTELQTYYPQASQADLQNIQYSGWSDPRFLQDPIWRAFLAFKATVAHNTTKGLYDGMHAAAQAAGKDPGAIYLGGNDVPGLPLGALNGDEMDQVNSEFSPTFTIELGSEGIGYPATTVPTGYVSGHTGPHYAAAASLERSQHAVSWYYLDDPALQGHPNLGEVLGYEALANNCILNTEVSWGRSPGTEATMLAVNRTIDRLTPTLGYRHRKGAVALLYATQSMHALLAPGGFVNTGKTVATNNTTSSMDVTAGFYGWGEALEESHTPYRVIPDYKLTSQALGDVSLLILPNVVAIDAATVTSVLTPYLQAGGTIVVTGNDSGSQETRDHVYATNSGGPLLYGLTQQFPKQALYLTGNPGLDFYIGGRSGTAAQRQSARTAIQSALSGLEQSGKLPIETSLSGWGTRVWTTLYASETAGVFYYDFLNADLNLASDALTPSSGGLLTLAIPASLQGTTMQAQWFDADGSGAQSLAVGTIDSGHASIQVPGFRVYGTLVLSGVAAGGPLYASPNPIVIAPGTTDGQTTLSWNVPGVSAVEVHVNSANGPLFTGGGSQGSGQTGVWVTDGMPFFLQNASNGNATDPSNTLAVVIAHVVTGLPTPVPTPTVTPTPSPTPTPTPSPSVAPLPTIPLQISAAGTGCSDNECLWITGTGFDPHTTVWVKDANWNNLNSYTGSALNLSLNQTPQVITLRLATPIEIQDLASAGLVVTVVRGDGSTWDSRGIPQTAVGN